MTKEISPQLGKESFSCPNCRAIAHQSWFDTFSAASRSAPYVIDEDRARENINQLEDDQQKQKASSWLDRKVARIIYFGETQDICYPSKVENICISQCFSCKEFCLWLYDTVLWPTHQIGLTPNPEMPPDVERDFIEAAQIVNASPRGAAALLRLSLQKLCAHLGESGKNIDADIAALVKKGLDTRLQQALDIIRVIGNEAVHPGTLDIRDDKETALQLFDLTNAIVEAMIAQPKRVAGLYERLPQNKRDAIERRDKAKALPKS